MQQRQVSGGLLSCRDFLAGHTEYLDGALSQPDLQRFDAHAKVCTACRRYDHVLRRGLFLVRNLPEIEPSDHFHERLQARLMHLDNEPVQQPMVASASTTIMVAAVLALITITPLMRLNEAEPAAAPVAAPVPASPFSVVPLGAPPLPAAFENGTLDQMWTPTFEAATFSPVVVSPPAVHTATTTTRLISYPLQPLNTR